jgi:hypothetical protein
MGPLGRCRAPSSRPGRSLNPGGSLLDVISIPSAPRAALRLREDRIGLAFKLPDRDVDPHALGIINAVTREVADLLALQGEAFTFSW